MAYNKPVKVGDVIRKTIVNLGVKGDGVTKEGDFIIIIPKAQLDRRYDIRIQKVFESFAIGEIVEEIK